MSIAALMAQQQVEQARLAAPEGFDPQNAATVIDSYGTELQANRAPAYAPMLPDVNYGRIRMCFFTVTLASQVAGEDIAVCILPKGARILGGDIAASATLANSAQLSVGLMAKDGSGTIDAANSVSDNVAYLRAAAVQGTAKITHASTTALGYGYKTEKELYMTISTSVGTVSTEVIKGHISFVVD